ncbi:MAG TPA: OmpH family outer membrane protein [Elusimicrobiota bacterium]|nr:OmpH family outer membrane protein [Elusimicrobiota bacterium]
MIALLVLSAPARAIELSLEENRGERGSVGFVDMERLFTSSPDAERAKEAFEDLVRQAEERVNLRKAELLKLRQELASTRVERDALAASMALTPETSAAAAPTPPRPEAAAAPAAPVAVSTGAAAAPRRKELALPGMAAPETAPTAPPAASSATARSPREAPAAVAVSTQALHAAGVAVVSSTAAAAAASMFPMPEKAPAVAQAPAGPTPAQRLLDLDGKIIAVQADIAKKESELTEEHDEADRGLLAVQSRKTDQVLARLYRAVSAVSREEGVSVVIDKSSVLYGNPAVDLTDRVLKYLQENAEP